MINIYTVDEVKGDVTFLKNKKKELYQRIGDNSKPFKVKDGVIENVLINAKSGYDLKYNLNGRHGFSVWKMNKCIVNNIWEQKNAEENRESILKCL